MNTTAATPAAVESGTFRAAMASLPSPVTVVTCYDSDGTARGLTVSAVCSLSLSPPMLLACVTRTSRTHDVLVAADHFCVNLLAPGQEPLARRFAGPPAQRFEGVTLQHGRAPSIVVAPLAVTCAMDRVYDGGDHSILIGRVLGVSTREHSPHDGLVWHQRGFAHTLHTDSSDR